MNACYPVIMGTIILSYVFIVYLSIGMFCIFHCVSVESTSTLMSSASGALHLDPTGGPPSPDAVFAPLKFLTMAVI